MSRVYKILRALLIVVVALALTCPAIVYVSLSLPGVQKKIARVVEQQLSDRIDARVSIGQLSVASFNRALLRDVTVEVTPGDTALNVNRLGAGIDLYQLAIHHRVVITYVEIVGADFKLCRDSIGAPLNIDPVLKRLRGNGDKTQSNISLAVNTVILRDISLDYDVEDEPMPAVGRFSPHHVAIKELSADMHVPAIAKGEFDIDVKRFKFKERSGLQITNLTAGVTVSNERVRLKDFRIVTPGSDLQLSDAEIQNNVGKPLREFICGADIEVGLLPGSHVALDDFSPLAPVMADYPLKLFLYGSVKGRLDSISDLSFVARTKENDLSLSLNGRLVNPLDSVLRKVKNLELRTHIDGKVVSSIARVEPKYRDLFTRVGVVDVTLNGSGDNNMATVSAEIHSGYGNITAGGSVGRPLASDRMFNLDLEVSGFNMGDFISDSRFGTLSFDASAKIHPHGYRPYPRGTLAVNVERFDFNGHRFSSIDALVKSSGSKIDVELNSDDPAAQLAFKGIYGKKHKEHSLDVDARVGYFDVAEVFPGASGASYAFKLSSQARVKGHSIDDMLGSVDINNVEIDRRGYGVAKFKDLNIVLDTLSRDKQIMEVKSDVLEGNVSGSIAFSSIVAQAKQILSQSVPALATAGASDRKINDFEFAFRLHDTDDWAHIFNLPVSLLGDSHLSGAMDYDDMSMDIDFVAPYIRKGNKLIEGTRLTVMTADSTGRVVFTSQFPTKHGPLKLDYVAGLGDNIIKNDVKWFIDREARYDGNISIDAKLDRVDQGIEARVDLNPSTLTFNDSTWYINRATVNIAGGMVDVDGINAHRAGQFVKIDGRASQLPDDRISIDLLGINLDYIFESLGIDKVMLGGDATGNFYASRLFSKEPHIDTPGLYVKGLSYNKIVLGDAVIKSSWNAEKRAISLDADIAQANGLTTLIRGGIYPLNDSLDITFFADKVNVGFMHNYMKAFASEVSGYASGRARLWGNFKTIDLEGDLKGDDLKIKIAFTNTAYTTNDSVTLRSGLIKMDHLKLTDIYGHSAYLDGYVKHRYFKDPSFSFNVTRAEDLLVYDESSASNPDWYGRIFGNGTARINGRPGVVDIDVAMSTAPQSTFTFVLNDLEEASDYTFITFRNRDLAGIEEREQLIDETPSSVKRLRQLLSHTEESSSSAYNITLQMDINPNAAINLLMDPVGGDRIRSRGNGNMRMTYRSVDNDLHIYGAYELEKGNYNFTLQDIIIKDFTIKPGSSISFTGDPFSAMLDIQAIYSLTANLTDLDESFSQDKDLNRTVVPVHALLKVTGPLQQPEIGFDLEFPTLAQDTYRKVRSIVSTEDMMNRQIIYLLALNRFYTPDYMASANRGNELVSVASSTLSSQLGNILGSLSDKWNIAPTFRSDRGDFSDMEVDVALSSSLLNNRLLFNGNFGYRDKSLNNNQFVGDFDLEYLLNRAGTVRLKAYNRFNDQNYYVRTAETTQGVGVSFRRNFDNFTELIRGFRRHKNHAERDTLAIPAIKQPLDSATLTH